MQAINHQPPTKTNQKPTTAIGWYFRAFRRAFDIEGRASRTEYWYFVFFNTLVMLACYAFDFTMFHYGRDPDSVPIHRLYTILTLIPATTITVRRLHDVGKSGLWVLSPIPLSFAAFILFWLIIAISTLVMPNGNVYYVIGVFIFTVVSTFLMLFLFTVRDSQPGTNRFGPNPKEHFSNGNSTRMDKGAIE